RRRTRERAVRLRALPLVPAGLALLVALIAAPRLPSAGVATDTLLLRGCPQVLHLYGTRGGPPAVVSSGDGGWVHLGPDGARFLGPRGFSAVGSAARAYVSAFRSR